MMRHHPSIKVTPFFGTHCKARGVSFSSVVGWGRKPLSNALKMLSVCISRDYVCAEDGFISYDGHPCLGAKRQGLILDQTGIYYDCTSPSNLESNILYRARTPLTKSAKYVASTLQEAVVEHGVGKYYFKHDCAPKGCLARNSVVLVEQIYGDSSLKYGCLSNVKPEQVIEYALKIANGRTVYLKNHPDIINGKKGKFGFLSSADPKLLNQLTKIPMGIGQHELMSAVDDVVTVTSQFGYEALLAGKKVHCFGVPFYSHWGLTTDINRLDAVWARRGGMAKPTILDLFIAAYHDYTTYVDLESGQQIELSLMLQQLVGINYPSLVQVLSK